MIPGMNPRKMQQMMRQMGIQQQELPAQEVIIRMQDKEIVISNPSVAKVNMMGQETFQISGDISERSLDSTPEINDEDVQTVASQTGCTPEQARAAIEESEGDLADAIMRLSEKEQE